MTENKWDLKSSYKFGNRAAKKNDLVVLLDMVKQQVDVELSDENDVYKFQVRHFWVPHPHLTLNHYHQR